MFYLFKINFVFWKFLFYFFTPKSTLAFCRGSAKIEFQ